jgi:hypothetical protein
MIAISLMRSHMIGPLTLAGYCQIAACGFRQRG